MKKVLMILGNLSVCMIVVGVCVIVCFTYIPELYDKIDKYDIKVQEELTSLNSDLFDGYGSDLLNFNNYQGTYNYLYRKYIEQTNLSTNVLIRFETVEALINDKDDTTWQAFLLFVILFASLAICFSTILIVGRNIYHINYYC